MLANFMDAALPCTPAPGGCRRDSLLPQTAHRADDLPFAGGYRLYREPRIFGERHILQSRARLDGRERHRARQRGDAFHVHRHKYSVRVGGIGISFAYHLGDPDHLLLLARVIEKGALALLHGLEIPSCSEIANSRPGLAFGTAPDLILPGKFFRFGLQQPIRHGSSFAFPPSCHVSARNGRISSAWIASSMPARRARMSSTADAIGISTPAAFAISMSAGAVKKPSASGAVAGSGGAPLPHATPKEKFRDWLLEQVRIRSPRPER